MPGVLHDTRILPQRREGYDTVVALALETSQVFEYPSPSHIEDWRD